VPASSETIRPEDASSASCGRCGYDLRGLDSRSRCPECGARKAGTRVRDAYSLARSAYPTIIGVAWRSVMVMLGQVGFLVVAISIIRTFAIWIAVPAAVATTLGVWFGTSIEMDPDRDGRVSPAARHLPRIGILFGATGFVGCAAVPGMPGGGIIEPVSISIMLGSGLGASILGCRTAWWLQDDRAQTILESAPWAYLLTIGGFVLVLGSHFAGLLPPAGIGATVPKLAFAAFVGAIGWGACVLFADVLLVASSVRCILHRAHHEDLEARRETRIAKAEAEFDERVRLMDGDVKARTDERGSGT